MPGSVVSRPLIQWLCSTRSSGGDGEARNSESPDHAALRFHNRHKVTKQWARPSSLHSHLAWLYRLQKQALYVCRGSGPDPASPSARETMKPNLLLALAALASFTFAAPASPALEDRTCQSQVLCADGNWYDCLVGCPAGL